MIDWKIQSRAHHCQACSRPFEDKQPYFTLLSDTRRSFDRVDVCPACWESQYSQSANHRKDFISFWQGVYSQPPPPPPDPIQKESAETLLRKILQQENSRHAAAAFILAVMLERKRILKTKTQMVQDGRRLLVYEHVKTGDLLTVADPNLQLDQLTAIQHEVAQLLEHGLPEEAQPPPQLPAGESGSPSSASPLVSESSAAPLDSARMSGQDSPPQAESPAAASDAHPSEPGPIRSNPLASDTA